VATPEPIPEGTIALVVRGARLTHEELATLVTTTGLTVIHLQEGQELEAMSEEDMGRAGWCRCPTPGFPVVEVDAARTTSRLRGCLPVDYIEPTPEMVKLHGRAMATGMANLTPADLEESP
jgi:hypothetical protein